MGMRKICHVAIERVNLSSSDMLFVENEMAITPCMYFVIHGNLQYSREHDTRKINQSSSCRWMCEAALYTSWTYPGTLRAVSESQLLYIDAGKFQEACQSLPTAHVPLYGKAFVDWLNSLARVDQTDQGLRAALKAFIQKAF